MTEIAAAISRLSAEFLDPAVESRFRRRHAPTAARHAAIALGVGAVFNLAFGYNDFLILGPGPSLWLLLGARSAVALVTALAVLALLRRPERAGDGRLVTLVEIAFVLGFLLVVQVRPEALTWHTLMMSIILLCGYLFVPNRFPYMAVTCLTATAAYMVVVIDAAQPMALDLSRISLLLMLTNSAGLLTAYRFSQLRRTEFALLMDAEAVNAQLRQEVAARRQLEEELKRVANSDPLTGLCNRRHFLELAEQELRHARRRGVPLAVCVLDLDNFKDINDRHGHAAGDEALRRVAELCQDTLRAVDIVGRIGGEEFALVLPDTDLAGAELVAERLREGLAAAAIGTPHGELRVTATAGVALCEGGGETLEAALHRADMALYQGKRAGRNRVELAPKAAELTSEA